jgi:parallel beta-helix repeat protein
MKTYQIKKSIIISLILLLFYLLIITTSTVLAEETIVFVDDDFTELTMGWNVTHFNTIQNGLEAVTNNGTINIRSGIYNEDIYLNKTVTISGESVENVWINGQIEVDADKTLIENLTIANVSDPEIPAGILDMSSNSIYRNLKLINNTCGIQLHWSSVNTVIDNNIFENNVDGIYTVESSSYAIISNNTFNNNVNNGIYVDSSRYLTITNNYIWLFSVFRLR